MPWQLLSVSPVRATGQVEAGKVFRVHAEWETIASEKSGNHLGSCPALYPFLFRLRRIPFGFTKETSHTALEGLPVDPNIIEVRVVNHKYRDKEHEYITCVPLSLVGI